MNELIESLVKPFLVEIPASIVEKVVVIYPGRFQPFGPHHKKTYDWIKKKFRDVYVTTSAIQGIPRHPLSFREKALHMKKMGIPGNKISKERTPYVANNVLKKFDSETTAVVYVVGSKDTGRLGSGKYFKNYNANKRNMVGYDKHGYVLEAPHASMKAGGLDVSGTSIRELLGHPKYEGSGKREKLFKKIFGYFNKSMFETMTSKFKKIYETSGDNVGKKIDHRNILFDKEMEEDLTIPIEIGDEILGGKFKNKRITVKSLGKDEKGDLWWPTVNGRPLLKYRLRKKVDEFLSKIDFKKIVKEASVTGTGGQDADSGPRYWWGNQNSYRNNTNEMARKLGFMVVDYILDPKELEVYDTDYPHGPTGAVSYYPIGSVGARSGTNVFGDSKGSTAYKLWVKHISNIATSVGYKLIDFLDANYSIESSKNEPIEPGDPGDESSKWKMPTDRVEERTFSVDWWKKILMEQEEDDALKIKGLLFEGGAYGHMSHPFDDMDLTFKDLKDIILMGLGGQLNREDNVTEKLDGQNIMISVVDGKVVAARNKGQLKNFGKRAMSSTGVAAKFKGRGEVRNAFVYAMKDLSKAIGSLSAKQKDKVFMNGKGWMNLEILWPKNENVINYDKAELVFHGVVLIDKNGVATGAVKGSASMLEGMIKQVNQNIQKHFKISKPVFLTIPKHQDFGKLKKKFLSQLNTLQNNYALKDSDTLSMYHQMYWMEWILNGANQTDYMNITNDVLVKLMKRWAFGDKSYKIPDMKKELKDDHPEFLDWVLATDKIDVVKMQKKNMVQFEKLFFAVGAAIMKNVEGFLAANPSKSVASIRKQVKSAIKSIQAGGDINKISKINDQLDKIEAIGGFDAIIPSEGIVFKYNGKVYKFTGAFAPVNQITGLAKFG